MTAHLTFSEKINQRVFCKSSKKLEIGIWLPKYISTDPFYDSFCYLNNTFVLLLSFHQVCVQNVLFYDISNVEKSLQPCNDFFLWFCRCTIFAQRSQGAVSFSVIQGDYLRKAEADRLAAEERQQHKLSQHHIPSYYSYRGNHNGNENTGGGGE